MALLTVAVIQEYENDSSFTLSKFFFRIICEVMNIHNAKHTIDCYQ